MRQFVLATGTALAGWLLLAPSASADEPAAVQQVYQIAAQPLGAALKQLATGSGLQLLFSEADVAGKRTAGISGRYTRDEAMRRILGGTGLAYTMAGQNVVVVRSKATARTPKLRARPIAAPQRAALAEAVAPAQSDTPAADGRLPDIVVTAQRRAESMQRVPIAVTAISGEGLVTQGLTSNQSLEGTVPNLTMSRSGSSSHPYLRGIGNDSQLPFDEPSVATYVDGFYIAAPHGNQMSLANLERIEVLKGPQGTLFGRNATGGVIHLITKDPQQEFSSRTALGYGNLDTVELNHYMTGGLADRLAADLAVHFEEQDKGLGTNLFTGNEVHRFRNLSARTKWLYESDRDQVTLAVGYAKQRDSGLAFRLAPISAELAGISQPGGYNVNLNVDPLQRSRSWNAALRYQHEFDFANFISSTYFGDVKTFFRSDSDGTPVNNVPFAVDAHTKQYTQEFQLQAPTQSRLQWQAGVYLFRFKGVFDLNLTGAAAGGSDFIRIFSPGKTDSIAGYGQATYEIMPKLKATAGIRYTYDKNTMTGFIFIPGDVPANDFTITAPKRTQSSKKPTWRIALDYQLTNSILTYASYNRGTKSGGFSASSQFEPGYDPEQLDAYEVGIKSELFDRRLRFNIAAFYYDFKDMQVQTINTATQLPEFTNAAAARMKGIDIDFSAIPFRNFTISGGVGFLDTKFTNYKGATFYAPDGTATIGSCIGLAPCAEGNRTPNAPKFTGSIAATYEIPTVVGDFRINATVVRKSKSYVAADNLPTYPAYTLLNGMIGWTSTGGRIGVDLWGKNLTNENYLQTLVEVSDGYLQVPARPRTYGVRLTVSM